MSQKEEREIAKHILKKKEEVEMFMSIRGDAGSPPIGEDLKGAPPDGGEVSGGSSPGSAPQDAGPPWASRPPGPLGQGYTRQTNNKQRNNEQILMFSVRLEAA